MFIFELFAQDLLRLFGISTDPKFFITIKKNTVLLKMKVYYAIRPILVN
jgi:hypothetical protein